MAKAIEIVYLTRVEGANLNAAGTEGVISILKKTTDIDGKEYIRISGQSVKFQIRKIWEDEGVTISPVQSRSETGGKVIISEGDPVSYIDDDLFGYMIETRQREESRKRTAAVRTNGMISLFPYQGDRDFAVRYDPQDPTGQHNIYEVEVTTNVMRGNFFIELDRVGKFESYELKEKPKDGKVLPKDERERRIKLLFDAIFHYFGGAHLSNYFTKTYPELMVVVVLKRKLPIIGDKLTLNGKDGSGRLILSLPDLKEVFDTFDDSIEEVLIGGFETSFGNWKEIEGLSEGKIKVLSMKDLRKRVEEKKFIES